MNKFLKTVYGRKLEARLIYVLPPLDLNYQHTKQVFEASELDVCLCHALIYFPYCHLLELFRGGGNGKAQATICKLLCFYSLKLYSLSAL